MSVRLLALVLLLTALHATAATPTNGFLLGQDYSEWVPPNAGSIASDKSGAVYILHDAATSTGTKPPPPSSVTKLSPDGNTIVWRNQLGFAVSAMAVDPNGGVYVTPVNPAGAVSVAKLNDNGDGIAWTQDAGFSAPSLPPLLAVDASGRAWVSGFDMYAQADLVRINASGTAIDFATFQQGVPSALTVDASGAAYITVEYVLGFRFTRFASDGSVAFSTTFSQSPPSAIAVDGNGNSLVYVLGAVLRFSSTGAFLSTHNVIPGADAIYPAFAADAAGNAYTIGHSAATYYPEKNSLATCGTDFLTVTAPDGSILQTTYIPGAVASGQPLLTVRADGSVLLVNAASSSYAPTRLAPFASAGTSADTGNILQQLSPNPNAKVLPVACGTNGASFQPGAISPGELITLFGSGLGPVEGLAANTQATLPTVLGDVQVTFDGVPARLIWAQDSQINLVTPSSLAVGTNTKVCVTRGFVLGCLTLPVAQTTPGVFTTGGTTAVALNQDGTVNSVKNPAERGSLVSVFVTGVGPISPAQADGSIIGFPLPSNTLPITVWGIIPRTGPSEGAITMISEQVTYAGPAPFRVAGISQINFRLSVSSSDYVIEVPGGQSLPFTVEYY